MDGGLTDKESLEGLMQVSRADRAHLARVKELASKGLHAALTPEETRELCDAVLHRIERRGFR